MAPPKMPRAELLEMPEHSCGGGEGMFSGSPAQLPSTHHSVGASQGLSMKRAPIYLSISHITGLVVLAQQCLHGLPGLKLPLPGLRRLL